MALMTGGIFGQVSGGFGGMEFARAGGRIVVKRRKTHKPRVTNFTRRAQADHKAAIAHWKGMTLAQRDAWDHVATQRVIIDRFGMRRHLNGFQWFMTMPHDWEHCISTHWADMPPVRVTPLPRPRSIGGVYPTFVYLNTVNWRWGIDSYAVMYVGRFCSEVVEGRQYTWVRTPMEEVYSDDINFLTPMSNRKLKLIIGERIRLRFMLWTVGYWPIYFPMPEQIVESPV